MVDITIIVDITIVDRYSNYGLWLIHYYGTMITMVSRKLSLKSIDRLVPHDDGSSRVVMLCHVEIVSSTPTLLLQPWHREVITVIEEPARKPQEKSSPSFIQHGKCLRRTARPKRNRRHPKSGSLPSPEVSTSPNGPNIVPLICKFTSQSHGFVWGRKNRGKDWPKNVGGMY